jgi:hypothetical protein
MTRASRPNPYCAFQNDRERRRALVSRDVRLVVIAVATAVVGMHGTAHAWAWLQQVLHWGSA